MTSLLEVSLISSLGCNVRRANALNVFPVKIGSGFIESYDARFSGESLNQGQPDDHAREHLLSSRIPSSRVHLKSHSSPQQSVLLWHFSQQSACHAYETAHSSPPFPVHLIQQLFLTSHTFSFSYNLSTSIQEMYVPVSFLFSEWFHRSPSMINFLFWSFSSDSSLTGSKPCSHFCFPLSLAAPTWPPCFCP